MEASLLFDDSGREIYPYALVRFADTIILNNAK